jgi:hypothetical protein
MRILLEASALGEKEDLVETGTKERQLKLVRKNAGQSLNVGVKVSLLIELTSTKLNPSKLDF